MASNLTISAPPATGVAAPPTELAPFGNTSASTKVSDQNYTSITALPTTPLPGYVDSRNQYIKGQQEWPR